MPPTTRETLAALRAKSPQHAELADLLDRAADVAEAPEGVTPIDAAPSAFRRLMDALRTKGARLLRGARNDNA